MQSVFLFNWKMLEGYFGNWCSPKSDAAYMYERLIVNIDTGDRWQSKTLLTINEHGSKITRNSVFDCHLWPVGEQMGIKNSVSNNFWSLFVNSTNVFYCRLSGVIDLSNF